MSDETVSEQEANEAEAQASTDARQRSTIAFPYDDLNSAVEVAGAIHAHVGTGDCSIAQLSAWMNLSPKSSGFRVQLAAARLFGVIESDSPTQYRLTALGRRIVDSVQARRARVEAFLNVPLFSALFKKYEGGALPPTAALEREIAGLGVAEKQKDRARQVFERSADQAGFFEHGRSRLVQPGVRGDGDKDQERRTSGNGGGGYHGPDDPLIAALIQKLPPLGSEWAIPDRITWLTMMTMAFQLAYGRKGTIIIKEAPAEAGERGQ